MLTCSEKDGSPPSEFYWFKDGVLMPTEPKSSRAFSNSSYSLDHKTGELVGMGSRESCGGHGSVEPLKVGEGEQQQGEFGIRVRRQKMGAWTLTRRSTAQCIELWNQGMLYIWKQCDLLCQLHCN